MPLLLRIANRPADPSWTGEGPSCAAAMLADVRHTATVLRTRDAAAEIHGHTVESHLLKPSR